MTILTVSPTPPIKAEKVINLGKYSRNMWMADLGKET